MRFLRSVLSSAFYYGSRITGIDPGTRILCYHNVNDQEKKYTTVSISNFKAQMEFLSQRGYRTIALSDVIATNRSNGGNSKTIAITFDDGWRDNYDYAFPILKQYGFKATIFLIADRIGEAGYLTVEQIDEMRRYGIEFGSHSLSHPDLTAISDEQKWNEIINSRTKLQTELHINIDFFCYPFGIHNSQSVELVRRAGYLGACSNMPGSNLKNEPALLKRTEIGFNDTLFDFEKKIAGAYDLLHQGLHWLRGRP